MDSNPSSFSRFPAVSRLLSSIASRAVVAARAPRILECTRVRDRVVTPYVHNACRLALHRLRFFADDSLVCNVADIIEGNSDGIASQFRLAGTGSPQLDAIRETRTLPRVCRQERIKLLQVGDEQVGISVPARLSVWSIRPGALCSQRWTAPTGLAARWPAAPVNILQRE